MALIARTGQPSIATARPSAEHQIAGLLAGETIAAGDQCTIKDDGKVYKVTDADVWVGVATSDSAVGEPNTLYHGVNFYYGAGVVPGKKVYLSATAGALDDAGTVVVGVGLPGGRIAFYDHAVKEA